VIGKIGNGVGMKILTPNEQDISCNSDLPTIVYGEMCYVQGLCNPHTVGACTLDGQRLCTVTDEDFGVGRYSENRSE
jgi:hypothetical protein